MNKEEEDQSMPFGWYADDKACTKCGKFYVYYRELANSDHDDTQFKCLSCGRNWHVDGSDY